MTDIQAVIAISVAITLALACFFIVWGVSRRSASSVELALALKSLSDIGHRVDGQEGRIASLESQVANMPSKETVHALDLSLTRLTGLVERLGERVDSSGRAVERIENYLLNTPTPAPATTPTERLRS